MKWVLNTKNSIEESKTFKTLQFSLFFEKVFVMGILSFFFYFFLFRPGTSCCSKRKTSDTDNWKCHVKQTSVNISKRHWTRYSLNYHPCDCCRCILPSLHPLFHIKKKRLVYEYGSVRLSYLYFAPYRSVVVFYHLLLLIVSVHASSCDSILKLMLFCSCCDIIYYACGVVGVDNYYVVKITSAMLFHFAWSWYFNFSLSSFNQI